MIFGMLDAIKMNGTSKFSKIMKFQRKIVDVWRTVKENA